MGIIMWLLFLTHIGETNSEIEESGDGGTDQSPQQMVLDAESKDPYFIGISWSPQLTAPFTLSYREKDAQRGWLNLIPSRGSRSHVFRRRNLCADYEFRVINPSSGSRPPLRSRIVVPPQIPATIQSVKSKIVSKEWHQNGVDVFIEVDVSEWPAEETELTAYTHIIDCNYDQSYPIPLPVRLNGTTFKLRFHREFVRQTMTTGETCEALFVLKAEAEICQQIIPINADIETNSVLVPLRCNNIRNIPCKPEARRPKHSLRSLCTPSFYKMRALRKQKAILLEWEMEKSGEGEYVDIRYGVADDDHSGVEETLRQGGILPDTQEGRTRVMSSQTAAILPLNPTAVQNIPHRFSICSVQSIETLIDWNRVPTFPISLSEGFYLNPSSPSSPALVDNSSRRPPISASRRPSGTTTARPNRRRLLYGRPTTPSPDQTSSTRPPQNETSTGNDCEGTYNWRPIAITVSLFTLANLVLLSMSCYLYNRARNEAKLIPTTSPTPSSSD